MAPDAAFPVIDIFAGPGGLAEGFTAFAGRSSRPAFRIALSIEKDSTARETLKLRRFVGAFEDPLVAYSEFLRGDLPLDELYRRYPDEARAADTEAWCAELGVVKDSEVDRRVQSALGRPERPWVLVGGPPCQAYSLVGRSRMRTTRPDFEDDERHFLYRQYLRILARHRPHVFVLENVKGILSSTLKGRGIFARILADLAQPVRSSGSRGLEYKLYALAGGSGPRPHRESDDPRDFVIRSEDFGVPQARHRVFILGVRSDLSAELPTLRAGSVRRDAATVLNSLPPLRSRLSTRPDSWDAWLEAVKGVGRGRWLRANGDTDLGRVAGEVVRVLAQLDRNHLTAGVPYVDYGRGRIKDPALDSWYRGRSCGVTLHEARGHMTEDLHRYLFASCFANVVGRSPTLRDFPKELRPDHANVGEALDGGMFADRFRVQLEDRPSSTVTSHISKDGHYFIHYAPAQCRSLTVREAARLQTFPDDYYFCGNRTQQYHQVGNAVPPLLAREVAGAVHQILQRSVRDR